MSTVGMVLRPDITRKIEDNNRLVSRRPAASICPTAVDGRRTLRATRDGLACAHKEGIVLGDKVWEGSGQTIGTRVLPGDDGRYVKLELTIEGMGKVMGVEATNLGTFTTFERVPGQMYAEGQGIVMTAEGEGVIWNGHGVGHPTGDGMGISVRYSISFQANASGKLAGLNSVLGVGEFESSADGSWTDANWEWK
jgi:hypothetical protein